MLSIQKLSFAHKEQVFEDFSLAMQEGDFIHLTGPNGAGKTSVLRLLAGLIPDIYPGRTSGRVVFRGKEIPGEDEISGICLTGPWAASRLFCRTVWEEVSFSPQADTVEAQRLLEYFGIADLVERHPQKLSGGQQQLVLLIAYLCCHPRILLLDECFAQLSAPKRKLLADLLINLHAQGRTILLVEHSLPEQLQPIIHPVVLVPLSSNTDNHPETVKIDWQVESVDNEGEMFSLRGLQTAAEYPCDLSYADISVSAGDLVHINGGVGSGKTTLLKMLCGLLNCRGDIDLKGRSLNTYKRAELATILGVVLQAPDSQFFCATVEDEIAFAARRLNCFDDDFFTRVCGLFGLKRCLERNPFTLSHGEQKKCQLASALMLKPQVLILDEPDAGMDQHSRRQLATIFADYVQGGGTILFTSHSQTYLDDLNSAGLVLINYSVEEANNAL